MEYRSTNPDGAYVHFGGAFVAGVGYGSGVEINATSSGTAPNIRPCGDETNKGLNIAGKGTGTLTLGSTVSPLTLNSSAITIGQTSTTPMNMIQRYRVDYTVPAMSSFSGVETTVTVSGLTTNSILVLQNRLKLNSTITGIMARARCSTADELTVELYNVTGSSLSGSTVSAYLLQISF